MNQNKKIVFLACVIYGYIIIYQTVILNAFLRYSDYINAAMMVLLMSLAIYFFGFKKDNPRELKHEILQKTIFLILVFFLLSFAFGLIIGFNKNAYSLKPTMIFHNIVCPLIIIVCMEVFRYVLINSTNNKKSIIFSVFNLFIFETFISIRVSGLTGLTPIFIVLTTQVIPYFVKNIVLSYLVKYGGLKPNIIYRIVMEMYIYVLPIIPNFGDYLTSMIGICFPIVLYISVLGNINEEVNPITNMIDARMLKSKSSWYDYALFAFLIVFITLISGIFPFTLVAIGSDSMSPSIKRGDAVIYQKIRKIEVLKEGNIVVYEHPRNHRLIVHRLISIKKEGNTYSFVTKGDYNNTEDSLELSLEDLRGVVKAKIKYAGYPTLIVGELVNKKE